MGVIIKYLKEYYSRDFSWPYFFLVMLMLTVLIYFNYWHQLERKYAVGDGTWSRGFMGYYLMYLLPFVCAFALQLLFFKNTDYIKNPWFWVILLLAPAFFSFRVNFDFHEALIKERWQMPERVFYLLSLNYIVRVFVLLLPVFICWLIKDRQVQPFYGTQALTNVKPYLLMLLVMLPLITLASTQKDFLQTYPKAQLLAAIPSQGWAGKLRYIVYELCYGFDFVSIEFFFRGFLILALMRICGTHCIIPVACFYCTIHLGKPMGEAISSFWGGMLLGIVSYNTGSVWGGLVVHLGIAWMMELGGWLGHVFKRG